MTEEATTTTTDRWTSALYNHHVAEAAWEAVEGEDPCPARERAAVALDESKQAIYSIPALNLNAVVRKLEVRWSSELYGDEHSSPFRQKIIGDLYRIQRKRAGIEEQEASGRSPEEAERLAADWRAALAEHDEHEQMLVEGPTAKWGGKSGSDIVAIIDEAAGAMLSLPAPTIQGVIRKLQVLCEDDRYDPIEGPSYVHIIGDLNRLSRLVPASPAEGE